LKPQPARSLLGAYFLLIKPKKGLGFKPLPASYLHSLAPIAGLILEPLPVGGWSICCLTALLATGASSFETAMSGFKSESIWLIVLSFFFAKVRQVCQGGQTFLHTLHDRTSSGFPANITVHTMRLVYKCSQFQPI